MSRGRPRDVMCAVFLLAVILMFSAGTVAAVEGDHECGTATACFPWAGGKSSVPCVRGRRMNLRFMLDVAQEYVDATNPANNIAVYGFCPVVDRLQIFNLAKAPCLTSAFEDSETLTLTHAMGRKYLSVFGFGMSNNTQYPQKELSAGAVLVGVNGSGLCGLHRSVALVHTLVLDIGLHNGLFNYIGASGPSVPPDAEAGNDTRTTEVVVQPAMVGFRPTCNAQDECLFDSKSVCVGLEEGKKNCALCYDSPEHIRDTARLRVWTSYYGTDRQGRPLLSSGLDPLSFRDFAKSQVFEDIARMLKNIGG